MARPLGADFHVGLAPSEDHRVAHLDAPERSIDKIVDAEPDSIAMRTFRSCVLNGTETETSDWRRGNPSRRGDRRAQSILLEVHSTIACGGTVDGVTLMDASND